MKRLMSNQSGVYRIYSRSGGDNYVGSAVCFRKRWAEHGRRLRKGDHPSAKLQCAWDERGEDDFEFFVLEFVPDKTLLIEREQYWIDRLDDCRSGFNICPTAGSTLGVAHTPKTRAKMSAAARNRTPETRAKMSAAARTRTPETRAKMSAAAKRRRAQSQG